MVFQYDGHLACLLTFFFFIALTGITGMLHATSNVFFFATHTFNIHPPLNGTKHATEGHL